MAQGLGTAMLQISNIIKNPWILLPPTLAGAIIGPISTCVFKMTNIDVGAGMGTSGLVGPIMTYQTMIATEGSALVLIKILVFQFILPAVLSYVIYKGLRNMGYIKDGEMKLNV